MMRTSFENDGFLADINSNPFDYLYLIIICIASITFLTM